MANVIFSSSDDEIGDKGEQKRINANVRASSSSSMSTLTPSDAQAEDIGELEDHQKQANNKVYF